MYVYVFSGKICRWNYICVKYSVFSSYDESNMIFVFYLRHFGLYYFIIFYTTLTLHFVCVCLCASYQRWEIIVYPDMCNYPTYLTTLKLQLETLNYNSVSTTLLNILTHIQDTAFRLIISGHLQGLVYP